jgi:hypothetical protein
MKIFNFDGLNFDGQNLSKMDVLIMAVDNENAGKNCMLIE